ncbi:MAG TPA: hypothetical protein V6D22_13810 [Candidatus Obscuribacterales bacterium]
MRKTLRKAREEQATVARSLDHLDVLLTMLEQRQPYQTLQKKAEA